MSSSIGSQESRPTRCDRREFLAATGVAAALTSAKGEEQSATRIPPGTSLRIDCQSHLFIPELLDYMEKRETPPRVYRKGDDRYVVVGDWHRRILPKHTDVPAKLADMDANGIQITAISTNDPGPERFGNEGARVARMINDYLAGLVKQHPNRFLALAVLPLQNMDEAMAELERCVNRLGMKGILLYSNLNGNFPDQPEYRPLFAQAEALDIPILLHPACPVTFEATKGYELAPSLGLMFDTTIALCRIIFSGILEQHPRLKLVCPHVGGTLPYLIGRVDHHTQVLKVSGENLKKMPSVYLKQVYLDTVTPIPLAIRYAYDFTGPDRLILGTDHPWVDPRLIIGNVQSLKLPREEEDKILGGNAKRLFRL